MSRAYRFERYLCRAPGDSVVRGLRGTDGDDPDPERFRAEHAAYRAALEAAGGVVEMLPALDDYPDSVFIEDAALCIGDTAIALRPARRRGRARLPRSFRHWNVISGGSSPSTARARSTGATFW